jgi:hypothetical protein
MFLVCPNCKNTQKHIHEVYYRGYITAMITFNPEKDIIERTNSGIYDYHGEKVYRCHECGFEGKLIEEFYDN